MQKLEQQCWRYLMTVIDPDTNVEILHELADRYDCPPLKLAAWRILQEYVQRRSKILILFVIEFIFCLNFFSYWSCFSYCM